MNNMVQSGELESLVAERIWQETELALASTTPGEYIAVLRECEALKIILPEVNALFGVPQISKYHPEIDTGVHTLMCLEEVVKLSDDIAVRYATLVHDVGKAATDQSKWPSHSGHEALGIALQDQIARRLRIPNEHNQLAALVCKHHTELLRVQKMQPIALLNFLESLDAFRRPERLEKFLLVCEAVVPGRIGFEDHEYPQRDYLNAVLAATRDLNFATLLAEKVKETQLKQLKTGDCN